MGLRGICLFVRDRTQLLFSKNFSYTAEFCKQIACHSNRNESSLVNFLFTWSVPNVEVQISTTITVEIVIRVYQNSSATFKTKVRPNGLFFNFILSMKNGLKAHLYPDVMALNIAYIIRTAKTQPQIQLYRYKYKV